MRVIKTTSASLDDGVKLKPAETELRVPPLRRRVTWGEEGTHRTGGITSQRSSANFNLGSPVRMMLKVRRYNSWTNTCVPLSCPVHNLLRPGRFLWVFFYCKFYKGSGHPRPLEGLAVDRLRCGRACFFFRQCTALTHVSC